MINLKLFSFFDYTKHRLGGDEIR